MLAGSRDRDVSGVAFLASQERRQDAHHGRRKLPIRPWQQAWESTGRLQGKHLSGEERATRAWSLSLICDHMMATKTGLLRPQQGGYPCFLQVIHPGHSTLLGWDQARGGWAEPSQVSSLLDEAIEPWSTRPGDISLFFFFRSFSLSFFFF